MDGIFAYILVVLLFFLCYAFLKKQNRKAETSAKLPPGSMGWPHIGETLQFYSQNPNVFFADKQKRYGEIFKTNILGCPCVMLASPEAARYVLVTQAHLFKPTYPKSKERLIGPSALFFHQGGYHMHLRKLVQNSLSLESLRNLVPDIEALAISAMNSWGNGTVINTFNEMKRFSFEVGILTIFGHLDTHLRQELKKNYWMVDSGYNSFPNSIPGSRYQKALMARKRLGKILSEIICERKEMKLLEKDLLGCLLNQKDEKGEILTDDQIADNIIGVLFAAQDTTASVMTWVVKYLHDDPKLLEAVKAEQKAIYESNEEGNLPLTWNQTRNMPITHKVVLESLRMASIISFTFREAVVDVEYKGFLIPKGWKAMPLFRNIHHNPEFFPDPQNFNPSRFEVCKGTTKKCWFSDEANFPSLSAQLNLFKKLDVKLFLTTFFWVSFCYFLVQVAPKPNTFMPFGSGVHACPGNELAKLEILVMIHHLVTKFRWEVVGSQNGIQYGPFPVPLHGLPARFSTESTSYKST